MPARRDRRRFLLAVATGNPALLRKATPRRCSAAAAPDRTGGDRPFLPPPVTRPADSAAVTVSYDAGAATPTQPGGPSVLGHVLTVVVDAANPPAPITSTTYCYDSARWASDRRGPVTTCTYDPGGQRFWRSGEEGC